MSKNSRLLLVTISVLLALLPIAAFTALAKSAFQSPENRTPSSPNATITVTSTDDELNTDGDCSLREAIQAANMDAPVDACGAGSGAETIVIPAGTYTLVFPGTGEDANITGDLDVLDDVTFSGAGAGTTVISGNLLDRVLHIVNPTANVSVHDLTVSDGTVSSDFGGGIYNVGVLTITNVTIENNTITGAGNRHGTALYNNGQATLDQVFITGNVGFQGTVYNETGQTLTVENSTIVQNNANTGAPGRGGAIYATGGTVNLLNSVLDDNVSSDGAAIMQLGGVLNIDQTTIQNHYSTTGAATGGAITLGSGVVATIQNSLIYNNIADSAGGGIYLTGGTLAMTNTTVTSNGTNTNGGGFYIAGGTANIFYSTIVSNTAIAGNGGGIAVVGGTATFASTILGNNTANTNPDCAGTIASGDFNLIESLAGCSFTPGMFDITGVEPLLAPIGNYGGPTWTHGVYTDSLALDQVINGWNGCGVTVITDQRGSVRPLNGFCDIGAFEGTVNFINDPPTASNDAYLIAENTTLQIPGSLGLVGHWRFDEGSGTVAEDSSGLSNDGALIGSPIWDVNTAPLNFNNPFALDFDGTGSDYVSVTDNPTLSSFSDFTLSAWVNLRDVMTDSKIINKAELAPALGYVMAVKDGNLYAEMWDTASTRYSFQAGTILTNTWTHLALTWQTGGDLIAYVDRVEVGRIAASPNAIGTSVLPLYIGTAGWTPGTHPVNGRIDDARVYARALNPNEIAALGDPRVLENDTDPDGDTLSALLSTPPAVGNLTSFDPDGAFEYVPPLNFTGVATFTYLASDGTFSDTATATITVFPAGNSAPVAISNTYTITEDWSISVGAPGLLAGDFDPDGDPISVTQVISPANGSIFFFNGDGSFGYVSNSNFNGVDTFSYIITDGFLTDTAVVTMNVIPTNDPPIANNDIFTSAQDIPLNVLAPGVLINDTDPELDSFSAFLITPPLTGTLTLNADGSFDYTPPLGFTGVVTFAYAASDILGTAVQFDGIDSYIDLGDSYESFGDISVEAWVYRDFATGAFEEIFSKDVINSFAIDNLGHLHFNLGDGAVWGAGVSSIDPIPLNQWVHLAATWDSVSGEAKLYINGRLDATGIINILVGNNTVARGIGQKPAFDTSTFPGIIDDVRVWNTVRTNAEIQQNMLGQLFGTETGLIGYYKLDDGAGLVATDSVGGIHGALTDFAPSAEWVNSPHPFSNLATVTLNILPAGSGPDLTIPTLIAFPNDVCQGEYFALVFALANQGSLNAGTHQVFIYDDPDLTGFTNQTFTASIPFVLAGQTRYFSLSANSFITGTRYIKAFADAGNTITETNELNNSAVIPINVQPDPAPTGSILINGGAISTTLPNLTLTLAATDTGNCATSPAEMRFSYDGFVTQWEPFATTKSIIVASTGEVRVAVQFKDEHNNISGWIMATIMIGENGKIYLPVIFR